jgi:hypothetical protein
MEIRKGYHGSCAQVRVGMNEALHSGARLKDAVIRTEKIYPLGHPDFGIPHPPCPSCAHVLKQFGIKYLE